MATAMAKASRNSWRAFPASSFRVGRHSLQEAQVWLADLGKKNTEACGGQNE